MWALSLITWSSPARTSCSLMHVLRFVASFSLRMGQQACSTSYETWEICVMGQKKHAVDVIRKGQLNILYLYIYIYRLHQHKAPSSRLTYRELLQGARWLDRLPSSMARSCWAFPLVPHRRFLCQGFQSYVLTCCEGHRLEARLVP